MKKASGKSKSLSSVPLMFAFRDAHQKRSFRSKPEDRVDGKRVLSKRGASRLSGVSEQDLRLNLAEDLSNLVNTISLESTVPLDDFPRVRRSILNFGVPDISHMTSDELAVEDIADNLRKVLTTHEPRFDKRSVIVERSSETDAENQRVKFEISAEMYSQPHNLSLEFVAELDVVSGKVQFTRLARI